MLRAEPVGIQGELYATVVDPGAVMEAGRLQLLPDADGYWPANFGPLAAGNSRVPVTGSGIEPVKDSFVVASRDLNYRR